MKNRAIIKALSAVTLFASLLSVFAGAVYAAGTECWFVRRNGNLQPRMSDRAALISKYGGYYIDEKHGDDNQEKVLYLTFDAGYENGNIEKILDTLRDESVPAAFLPKVTPETMPKSAATNLFSLSFVPIPLQISMMAL